MYRSEQRANASSTDRHKRPPKLSDFPLFRLAMAVMAALIELLSMDQSPWWWTIEWASARGHTEETKGERERERVCFWVNSADVNLIGHAPATESRRYEMLQQWSDFDTGSTTKWKTEIFWKHRVEETSSYCTSEGSVCLMIYLTVSYIRVYLYVYGFASSYTFICVRIFIHFLLNNEREDHDCCLSVRGRIQKFPEWVNNEINNKNKHLLRSNTKGYGGKTH